MRLYRAEGAADGPGYAGTVDERTGRYFGSLGRAMAHRVDDRHLYEVDLSEEEAMLIGGDPDDHVLLSVRQAARKRHSSLCSHPEHPEAALRAEVDLMSETYRVVPSTTPLPSALATARRYTRVEDAVGDMGEGVVVGVDGPNLRLVAFHERHLPYVERTDGAVKVARPS